MSIRYVQTPPGRLTEADFCTWVGEALPGDTLEYHRGFLALDIAQGALTAPEQRVLRRLAGRAAWAADCRLVHLVQRRRGPGDFSYLAVKRPRPRSMRARSKAERRRASAEPELEEPA